MGTDRDWEAWGRDDPYYGVLSAERFRRDTVNASAIEEFFRSGEKHVRLVLDTIRDRFDNNFTPRETLDFGCGVGRLLIPFAKQSGKATGVDISPSMLQETGRNCQRYGVTNTSLFRSDDTLSLVPGEYDLVHSFLVLQHIPEQRGLQLIKALARKVIPGGYLAVHFYDESYAPKWKRLLVALRYRFPPLNFLRNLLRGRPLFEPAMQIHVYSFPRVIQMLSANGFGEPWVVRRRTEGGDFGSAFVFAKRRAGGGT